MARPGARTFASVHHILNFPRRLRLISAMWKSCSNVTAKVLDGRLIRDMGKCTIGTLRLVAYRQIFRYRAMVKWSAINPGSGPVLHWAMATCESGIYSTGR